MSKRNNLLNSDDHILVPLVKRPDLDPDPHFVQRVRGIINQNTNTRKTVRFDFKIAAAMISIIFILMVSGLSFFTTGNEVQQQASPENENPVVNPQIIQDKSENEDSTISHLIEQDEHFSKMFDRLYTGLNDRKASEVVVFYLHALKNGNVDGVKKYAFSPEKQAQIEHLISHYQSIDYSTLTITDIIPSRGEPSFEIIFQYMVDQVEHTRSIHLNLTDEYNISIYEPNAAMGK